GISSLYASLNLTPRGQALTFILNFWNAFNTTQYGNYSGVMTSTFFARPNRANNPRNVEVGMRLNF
ncbi:MAG: hypothetical protein DMG11_27050, partial [Acidobacteria bacterium]